MSPEYLKADLERIWIYIVVAIIWGFSTWMDKKRKERLKNQPAPSRESTPQTPVKVRPRIETEEYEPYSYEPEVVEDEEHSLEASEHTMAEAALPAAPNIEPGRLQHWTEKAEFAGRVPVQKKSFLPPSIFPTGAAQGLIASEILSKPRSLKRWRYG